MINNIEIIEEKTTHNRFFYTVKENNKTRTITTKQVVYTYKGKDIKGILRSNGEIPNTVTDFLENKVTREGTKIGYLRDLTKFYQFLDCLNINEMEFLNDTNNYFKKLGFFLIKEDCEYTGFKMKFINEVTDATAANALSAIRYYLNDQFPAYVNKFNGCRFKMISKSESIATSAEKKLTGERALTLQDLSNVIKTAKEMGSLPYALILFIADTSCRIGTALGLTEEDISTSTQNGQVVYKVVLRNRNSNKHFQMIKNRKNNKNNSSKKSMVTYTIEKATYDALIELIRENKRNSKQNAKKKLNFDTDAVADKVYKYSPVEINHYVFLNRQCKRLEPSNWNKVYLKQIFNKCNINIKGIKNHLFRHSNATIAVEDFGFSLQELKTLLRDTSDSAAKAYINNSRKKIEKLNRIHSQMIGLYLNNTNEIHDCCNTVDTKDKGGASNIGEQFI